MISKRHISYLITLITVGILVYACNQKSNIPKETPLTYALDSLSAVTIAEASQAYVSPKLAEGLTLDLWASDSLAPDPIAIDIDDDLLSRAIDTDIKRRMIDAGADPFYEWFHSDEVLGHWLVGEFAPVAWIKDRYLSWAKEKAPRSCTSSVYAQTKIDELVSEGYLSAKTRKRLHDQSRPWGYFRHDPTSEAPHPDPASSEVIKRFRKNKAYIELCDRVTKNQRTA